MRNRIRIITLAVASLLSLPLAAQHYIGIKGGYGAGSARLEPAREMGWEDGLISVGVGWKYYSKIPFVGAIGAELQYNERGYKVFPRVGSDTSYNRKVELIEMPLIWQPHVYVFNKKGRAFLNLGVFVSYNIASDSSTVSKQNGVLHSGNYPLRIVKDNIWGYGLIGGVGFGVLIDRFEIVAEGRYTYGYSDILKNGTKYPGNPTRSPLDGLNISLGLYYRLGKGGILSPQAYKRKKESAVAEYY